jgi:hypothetical protein
MRLLTFYKATQNRPIGVNRKDIRIFKKVSKSVPVFADHGEGRPPKWVIRGRCVPGLGGENDGVRTGLPPTVGGASLWLLVYPIPYPNIRQQKGAIIRSSTAPRSLTKILFL